MTGFPAMRPLASPRFIQPSSAALYNCISTFAMWRARADRHGRHLDLSTQSTGTWIKRQRFIPQLNWRISRSNEAAIDEIVASCDGDIHGALKALLLVNEQLEAELQQLYAAVALGGPFERGNNALPFFFRTGYSHQ